MEIQYDTLKMSAKENSIGGDLEKLKRFMFLF